MGCVTSVPKDNQIVPRDNMNMVQNGVTSFDSDVEYDGSRPSNSPHRVAFNTRGLPDRHYLIQIIKATDIPKMDNFSESDPYVILKIMDCDTDKQKGKNLQSLYRMDNPNPTWNCYRSFTASEFHDKLRFEIWEKDFTDKDDFVGYAELKLSEAYINLFDDDNHDQYDQQHDMHGIEEINHFESVDDGMDSFDDSELNINGHDLTMEELEEQKLMDIESGNDEECIQELLIHLNKEKHQKNHQTFIYFKLFAMQKSPTKVDKKTIFFIRHGESEWNSAQHKKQLHRMYKQVDHPLNIDGIEQAMKLNTFWKSEKKSKLQRDVEIIYKDNTDLSKSTDLKQQYEDGRDTEMEIQDLNDFLSSQIIYASPLCRATQTAILTLLDHPTLSKRGLIYARNLREIKTAGGADTLANKTGKLQFKKAIDHILKYKSDLNEKVRKIHIDYNDASDNQKWWSSSIDTKKDFHARLRDFMFYLRYSNENNVICVGHSLWFKGFFKRYVNVRDIDKFSSKKIVQDCILTDDKQLFGERQKDKELKQSMSMKNPMIVNHEQNINANINIDDNDDIHDADDQDLKRTLSKQKSLRLMNELQSKKVENAGCVRVDLAFSDSFENGLKIEDVRLLFGTQLI